MATATPSRAQVQQATSNQLRRPLHWLGRSIRTYVLIEGVALGLGLACLWFWLVLLLDWGTFKALGVDYLREAPLALHTSVRWILLGCLIVAILFILIFKLVTRLLTSFDDSALALVLERRFPGVLEDRLVTAVELSDQDVVREYGYSEEMVDSTRQSAAERVERLSLGQVFDWRRLYAFVGAACVLFLTVISFALLATDTAARFVERDVLLMTTYWPRSVLLELPTFPDSNSKAVPHGGDLRVPIKAWKYVVADSSHPEGWRPLSWSDCLSPADSSRTNPAIPWELAGLSVSPELLEVLPDAWIALTLDEVEAKVARSSPTGVPDEREPILAELGFALIERIRGAIRQAQKMGNTTIEPELVSLLPDAWQRFSLDQLDDHLRASRVLTPSQVDRFRSLLRGEVIGRSDEVQLLNSTLAPITPPVLTTGLLQQAAVKLNPETPPLLLSESDLELLPREWRSYSIPQLEAELSTFTTHYAPEKLGNRVRTRLITVFDELDERAHLIGIGRRSRFRVLTVPDEVTVEFEQLLTEEERGQLKPRLGKPRVRRQAGSNEFNYEFKKIDRALRFRVIAGATSTSWREIDVRDLPLLRRLTRTQSEMGYLHGSNERVALGPFPISLEGDESQVEVPSGTRLQFDGTCQKKLRWVRLSLPDQRAHDLWAKSAAFGLGMPLFGTGGAASLTSSCAMTFHLDRRNPYVKSLHHDAEAEDFSFTLYELASDDLKLEIEFEDLDGIVGRRRLTVKVAPDREPEFKKAQPEIVRRRMITPLAVVPFSGHIHDDHGLLAAEYEVTVEQPDRKIVRRQVFPMRHFRPLRLPADAPDDLSFEKREDVTPSRMLAGPWADHAWAAPAIARMPLLGLLGWAQPPHLEPARDYVFEFRARPGSEPVLSPGDEFFDTLLLREKPNFAQPAESGAAPLPLPYRITVRLVARDNRVRTGPNGKPQSDSQESRSSETFDFTVVSEEELLIENGRREEDLRDRCESIIANIQKGRMSILKRLREDSDSGFQAKEGNFDFRRASADAMDMHKLLIENQLALDNDVARAFREIYREFVLNRCKEQVLERIDKKICRPLEATLLPGQHFARAEESVEILARRLETEKQATPRLAIEEAIERTDRLVQRLEEILGEMKKLIEFNQALKVLQEIIDKQKEILEAVRKKEREERLKELNDR